ncbi:MAG: APC family permease [Rothia sp. (in: high G+C Gram-positive bacteria)]|nr:APC family permease [Rothia sp. (in: high G+C Gram-positive bacteria)]
MSTQAKPALSLTDAVFIGAGSMIGAGLFAAFAPAAAAAGSYLFLSLALAAFLAFTNAASSAQLAAQYPASGGTYLYGKKQLGHFPGFMAGWCFVVGKTASCAAMALTFATYAAPAWQKPVAVAAVLALTAVNYRGITRTATLTKVLVTLVLLGVLVFLVAAGAGVEPAVSAQKVSVEPGFYGVLQGAGLLFFAFAGYARIATMGGEIKDPVRNIPRAIILTLSLVLLLYALVAGVLVGRLGIPQLAGAPAPLAAAVGSSPLLVGVVSFSAALAALGALLALITGIGRTGQTMAAAGDLPAFFAPLHPVYGSPARFEVTLALAVCCLILLCDLRAAIGFSSFGVLLYYFIANISAYTQVKSQRRYPRWLQVAGAAGCFITVWTLPPSSLATGLLLLAAGAIFYLVYARKKGNRS